MYVDQFYQKKKHIEKIEIEEIYKSDILLKLALVSQWVLVEKYGFGYRLKNGNFGMRFNDKTHMFTYLEDESQDMVSYIPKDKSA